MAAQEESANSCNLVGPAVRGDSWGRTVVSQSVRLARKISHEIQRSGPFTRFQWHLPRLRWPGIELISEETDRTRSSVQGTEPISSASRQTMRCVGQMDLWGHSRDGCLVSDSPISGAGDNGGEESNGQRSEDPCPVSRVRRYRNRSERSDLPGHHQAKCPDYNDGTQEES